MRWNDWAAVGSVGAIVALFAWIIILAVVAVLDIAGFVVAFHPLGWPLAVAIAVGALGSFALWAVDNAVTSGID